MLEIYLDRWQAPQDVQEDVDDDEELMREGLAEAVLSGRSW